MKLSLCGLAAPLVSLVLLAGCATDPTPDSEPQSVGSTPESEALPSADETSVATTSQALGLTFTVDGIAYEASRVDCAGTRGAYFSGLSPMFHDDVRNGFHEIADFNARDNALCEQVRAYCGWPGVQRSVWIEETWGLPYPHSFEWDVLFYGNVCRRR